MTRPDELARPWWEAVTGQSQPEYNRGWADGNASGRDACNRIIARLQAELAEARATATPGLDVEQEYIDRARIDGSYVPDALTRATATPGLREAAQAALDYLAPWVADPASRGIVPHGELVVAKLRAALSASGETEPS